VLSEFADRVGGSYGAGELLPTMARTVAEGVGAARTEVWLSSARGLVREAVWPDEVAPDDVVVAGADPSRLAGDRVVEVRHQGELLGALSVSKAVGEQLTPAEEKLLDDVAAQAGLVLRNVRLIEDLRSSRQRLVTTADQERARLERNLHDGAQQSLVSVALMLSTARSRLGPTAQGLGTALEQATEQLRAAIDELRELARGIHPVILTERGLGPAIGSLAERSPVPVKVDYRLEQERLPAAVEASLYFVVAEALTNIAKYAHATQVTVTVSQVGRAVIVEVADDGIGGADESRGSGLRGLADRVAVVDGTLTVTSPPGRGTTLTCEVPVADANRAPATPDLAVTVSTR
jgi:signal transduction histidine kinase